jgi:hypothetical protein
MATALFAPAPDGSMEIYEISQAVNRVANDSAALLEPVSAEEVVAAANAAQAKSKSRRREKDDGQASLF